MSDEVKPTDVNLDTGHTLSKMLVRPSSSSDVFHDVVNPADTTSDIENAPRKTLTHLLASSGRFIGPLGADVEASSGWKNSSARQPVEWRRVSTTF